MRTTPKLTARSAGWPLAECVAICIPPDVVSQVWPHVFGMVRQAFVKTDLGLFRDMEEDVFAGRALLWVAWKEPEIEAAVVTQLRITEGGKVCLIGACGGRRARNWLALMSAIENHAREEGCNKIRAIGRKGWLRLLPDFHSRFVVIEKELS